MNLLELVLHCFALLRFALLCFALLCFALRWKRWNDEMKIVDEVEKGRVACFADTAMR